MAQYERFPQQGSHYGYDWVDLGLPSGLKWATCNVGACNPEEAGEYFAWGETRPKSSYTRANSTAYGESWGDIGGDSNRDAARANWGGSWRMPTKAEFQELIDNCTWTWTTRNGHNGNEVMGRNGYSIFLPAAGVYSGDGSYTMVSTASTGALLLPRTMQTARTFCTSARASGTWIGNTAVTGTVSAQS